MALNTLRSNLVFLFFIIANTLVGQTIDAFKKQKETYFEVMRLGNFQVFDSLIITMKNSATELKEADSNAYTESLMYQMRMLAARNKMRAAYAKLDTLKRSYENLSINNTSVDQVVLLYENYLRLQLTRQYDYDRTVSILNTLRNSEETSRELLAFMEERMGRTNVDFSKHEEALQNFRKAKILYDQIGYVPSSRMTIGLIAVAHDGLENLDSVLYYNKLSIKLGSESRYPNYDGLASSSYNIGLLYQDRLSDPFNAEEFFLKAVDFDLKGGGPKNPYLCEDYRALAETYLAKNDINRALLYAEKAVTHGKNYFGSKDSRTGQAILALAEVKRVQGHLDEALQLANEGHDLFRNLVSENHRWISVSYIQLAKIKSDKEEYEAAIRFYQKAANIAKNINRDLFLIQAYEELLRLHEIIGKYDIALEYADSLKVVLDDRFKGAKYRKWNRDISEIRLKTKKHNDVAIQDEIEDLLEQMTAEEASNQTKLQLAATDMLWRSMNVSDDTITKDRLQMFLSLIAKSRNEFSEQQNRVYFNKQLDRSLEAALAVSFENHERSRSDFYRGMLFKLLEVNKNSALLDGIQNVRFKDISGVPSEVIQSEQAIQEQLNHTRKTIDYLSGKEQPNQEKIQQFKDRLLQLNNSKDSIYESVGKQYPKYTNLKQLSIQRDFEAFKQQMSKDHAVIEYFLGKEDGYRMLLTKEKVTFEKMLETPAIIALIETFRDRIEKREPLEDIGAKLYEKLIPKLPAEITTVTFITDAELNFLPFEVLQKDGRYLLETYAIGYAGSLQLLEEQDLIARSGSKWFGYAPKYQTNLLPNNQKEVQEIGAILQGETFMNEKATKETFLNTSNNGDILHLALHTELDNTNPLYNRMLFTKDSLENELTAAEVYQMNLNANLIVLSSCNTGFGKLEKGEGVMSMSRAFTYAGVSSNIMSLWKVPDKETSKIMEYFYTHLKEGQHKDEALRNAKLDYLSETDDELLRHPFYWAGFIISGNTSPVVEVTNWWLWAIGAMLVMGVVFRRRLLKLF